MKSNFTAALKFALDHECVFEKGHYGDFAHVISENVSGDRGGLTKFGIDQRSHPNINIRELDYSGAAKLYQDDEWSRCRCDELPPGYDIAVFDIAIPSGKGEAIILLQRALNQANADPSLREDAQIGPKTLTAAARGGAVGLDNLLHAREALFYNIVKARPVDSKFLRGWLNRNDDLRQFLAPYFRALQSQKGPVA